MWVFLILLIALISALAGYFFGWYMCEETYHEPRFKLQDDSDIFWADEQKLEKYKADDHE